MPQSLISKSVAKYLGVKEEEFTLKMKEKGIQERLTVPYVRSWGGIPPSEIVELLGEDDAYDLAETFDIEDDLGYLEQVLTNEEKVIVNNTISTHGVEAAVEIADYFASMHEPIMLGNEHSVVDTMLQQMPNNPDEAILVLQIDEEEGSNKDAITYVYRTDDDNIIYQETRTMILIEENDMIRKANIFLVAQNDDNKIVSGYYYNKGKFFGLSSGQVENAYCSDEVTGEIASIQNDVIYIETSTITRYSSEENTMSSMFDKFEVGETK